MRSSFSRLFCEVAQFFEIAQNWFLQDSSLAKFNSHHSGLHSFISPSSSLHSSFLSSFLLSTPSVCPSICHLSTIHLARCYWTPAMLGVGNRMVNMTGMLSACLHGTTFLTTSIGWCGRDSLNGSELLIANCIVNVPTSLPPPSSHHQFLAMK